MGQPHRIWVVDDDPEVRSLLATYLSDQGYAVRTLADGAQLKARLDGQLGGERPDLLVLDLMLPGEDGLTLLRRLRDGGDPLPVLMLTARADGVDRIIGLEQGADDYLAKPFLPRELTARIEAILRRRTPAPSGSPQAEGDCVRFGDCTVDLSTRELRGAEGALPITSGEFALLAAFVRHPHRPLSRERLIELARGPSSETESRSMDVQISRLRKLIEPDPARPRYVQTVWGYGYVFVPMANPASARQRLAPLLRPLGYGAAAAGFTALGLVFLHLLLAQRLERQQRRQLASQVSAMVLLGEVALERYSPSELAVVMGTPVVVGPRPPRAVTPTLPAAGSLRRQAEALRADLCRKLTSCPLVWPVRTAARAGPGRGAWVQLNTSLETAWLFVPIPALRGWPPDPQLLSLAAAFGGVTALLLFLSLEVQRPLRQLDAALEGVGLDQQPRPVPERGTGAVRHLTAHFNTMVRRLQQASQERATMLAGIAHDLRSPLTRLRLRLARQTPWTAEERQRAERDLTALEQITAQFLLFVGAEGKESPLRLPLEALVAEAANAVDTVELALEPMERCVRPVALTRAVANLLLNAETHGQPPLRLALRPLPEEGFAIAVADGGPGIPEAEWERAKQPFQRLDPARGGLGHSGLGLAIAERVARAHGGTLSCRKASAAEGGGFVVVLTGHSLLES